MFKCNLMYSVILCAVICCLVVWGSWHCGRLSEKWQCLLILVETQQRGKEKRQFCTLSPFQYIMLTRGILWTTATIITTLCPLSSLCFSSRLDPSYCTACFLPPLTRLLRASLCVCAQHVPPVRVCSTWFMRVQLRCLISTLCLIAGVWLWVCACAPLYLLWI